VTLDEAFRACKGKVSEWRIQRSLSYLIHCSLIEQSKRVNIMDYQPLPFDDELREETNTEDAMAIYNRAVSEGYFEKPL
jgi:hypothetical protein